MKYAIYGANRVAKDFLYVFPGLDDVTCCYAAKEEDGEAFAAGTGLMCRPESELWAMHTDVDELIVCDFPGAVKDEKIEYLDELGFRRGIDYRLEEDFFATLDDMKLDLAGKHIYVWGCGRKGELFYQWNARRDEPYEIAAFLDMHPDRGVFHDHKVELPDGVVGGAPDGRFVIITIKKHAEILADLEKRGWRRFRDYCTYEDLMNLPSEMLRRTIFERKVYDLYCESMLNHAEIGGNGEVICCCSTFIENALGNIAAAHGFNDCWQSIVHRILCLSNVNRTYPFCLTDMCPLFIGRTRSEDYDLARPYPDMESSPRTVAVGYDATCNLRCITCRDDIRVAKGEAAMRCQQYADVIARDVLPGCEFLIMAGDGEVLLSPAYRALYTSPAVRHLKWLRLLTNGTLFTPEKWQELRSHTDAKIMMTVSIDAATAETYEKIRRGGHFDQLQKNMEFAAKLRKAGELSYLRFNFVVQRENYREMIPFAQWGEALGIDEVFFTKILNWGTYTHDEFRAISMMEEDGLTPKPELQAVLDNPVMQHPIVDLGTIRYHREGAGVDDVKNYYRWELERKVPGLFEGDV